MSANKDSEEVFVTKAYRLASQFLALNNFQQDSFLVHITKAQCKVLQNIMYNLLLNGSLQSLLSEVDRRYLRRSTRALRGLASRNICLGSKRAMLVKKTPLVRRVMIIILRYIDQQRLLEVREEMTDGVGASD